MNTKEYRKQSTLSVEEAADALGVETEVLEASAFAHLIPHAVHGGELCFTETHIAAIRAQGATPIASERTGSCCIDRDPHGMRLWCRDCAAVYLAVASKTLANWSYEQRGPRNVGRKNAPRYRKSDLDEWLECGAA